MTESISIILENTCIIIKRTFIEIGTSKLLLVKAEKEVRTHYWRKHPGYVVTEKSPEW